MTDTICHLVATRKQAHRRRGSAISKYRRRQVFECAGYHCQGCGDDYSGATIRTVMHADGRPRTYSLEVDHIVPVKHGGTNALDNLQALCTLCNARKGAKI